MQELILVYDDAPKLTNITSCRDDRNGTNFIVIKCNGACVHPLRLSDLCVSISVYRLLYYQHTAAETVEVTRAFNILQ